MPEFFLDINPPRTTAQQQKTAIVNGKPRRYDPPSLKAAKRLLLAALAAHKPKEAYIGAVKLTVCWQFPRGRHKAGYKITRPDTDNLQKLLKDCMTVSGFWMDDAQVAVETVAKVWSDRPGIYVKIEGL